MTAPATSEGERATSLLPSMNPSAFSVLVSPGHMLCSNQCLSYRSDEFKLFNTCFVRFVELVYYGLVW